MNKTIVFVHAAWMTPLCWGKFVDYFESRGYHCLAPAWPYRDKPIESLRNNPPIELAGLGVREIVDHYDKVVRTLEAPLLPGSFRDDGQAQPFTGQLRESNSFAVARACRLQRPYCSGGLE